MKHELLAPAGDVEAGYAALYYGADAVYLGLKKFSARAGATNFDEKTLNEFVGYAHSLKKKVFVAINTLVQEKELSDLMEQLNICSACNVDAVILQDLGVAKIIKDNFPNIEMHASTQMAVHNKEGALFLKKLGFTRVVVARELSLKEIKEIASIPDLETEAFVHGALCYSYSGLCFFSSMETGRSANRGKCLYPCRACFNGDRGAKHYFSMKDMALEEDVLKMPVTSLKIEGRKKSALYVAAVTDYYRNILDGKKGIKQKSENIKQIFSRPWSRFHFNGKDKSVIDRDFVGHRGLEIGKIEKVEANKIAFKTSYPLEKYDGLQLEIKGVEKPFGFSLQNMFVKGKKVFNVKSGELVEVVVPSKSIDIREGQAVYLSSSGVVKNSYEYSVPKSGDYKQKPSVNVKLEIYKDIVKVSADGMEVSINEMFDVANNPEKIIESAKKVFAKTGDFDFSLGKFEVKNPMNLFVPASVLNDLRRDLYAQVKIDNSKIELTTNTSIVDKKTKYIIKTDRVDNAAKVIDKDVAEFIVLILSGFDVDSLALLPKEKVRVALPALMRDVEKIKPVINDILNLGYKKWEVANYWGLELLAGQSLDISLDSTVYMMNSKAMELAKEIGISRVSLNLEDTADNIKALAGLDAVETVVVVYQDVPAFTSAACVRSNKCGECDRRDKWIRLEKNGQKYNVLSKDCVSYTFFDRPYYIANLVDDIKPDYYRLDFTYKKYSAADVDDIFSIAKNKKEMSNANAANWDKNKVF